MLYKGKDLCLIEYIKKDVPIARNIFEARIKIGDRLQIQFQDKMENGNFFFYR